jgi:glycosyltransferase involved in cell wall biosynthesis
MVGGGTEHKEMIEKVKAKRLENNVKFLGYAKGDAVSDHIAGSDLCLGIFGDTKKTKRVIPNKVYECLAMKKPVLTGDTPAAREIFTGEHLMFCKIADGKDMAEKILALKNDKILRDNLASRGYQLYLERFCPKALGKDLLTIIEKYYGKK